MRPVFIYALNCPITGQTRYVGKTTNIQKRFRRHLQTSKTGNDHRANWIRSLRAQNRVPELEMLAQVPETEWAQWEIDYITYFRAIGCDLVNTSGGGRGLQNPTPETRAKMRAARLGKPLPPEQREKMRLAHIGKKHTPESLAKMCGRPRQYSLKGEKHPFFGKHHTTEAREKIKAARQRQTEKQREQKLCLTTISQ